jgi:hypothetical protein
MPFKIYAPPYMSNPKFQTFFSHGLDTYDISKHNILLQHRTNMTCKVNPLT